MPQTAFLASRAVLKIAGPDARSFLQGIATQNVESLKEGEAAFSALLTPQGKILFDFILVATGDGFLVDCASEAAESLAKRLSLYRLRAKVTIEAAPGLAVGAAWNGALENAPAGVVAFMDPRLAALGQRVIGQKETVLAIADQKSEPLYDAHRLALGVPEFGRDFGGDEVFLLDVNYDALKGVDYKKGCFVGQEVTSRMKRKGEVRKRTLALSLDGPPPPKGTPVMAGENAIGETLSGATGSALALIRIDRLAAAREAGSALTADGREVRISVPGWLEQR
ncbi:MAG: hypothetical protein RIC52_15215 [Amphiplicatus sp.]